MSKKMLAIKVKDNYINIDTIGYVHLLKNDNTGLIQFFDQQDNQIAERAYQNIKEAEKAMMDLWTETLIAKEFIYLCDILIRIENIQSVNTKLMYIHTLNGNIYVGENPTYHKELNDFLNHNVDIDFEM